jgi:hypothetical protein
MDGECVTEAGLVYDKKIVGCQRDGAEVGGAAR